MDLHNNDIGINYTADIFSGNLSNNQISNAISYFLTNGPLWYLNPLDWNLSPPYDSNNDGNQDCPNCLNGIISTTTIEPTN